MDEGNFLPTGGFRRGLLAGSIFVIFAFLVLAGIFPLPLHIAEPNEPSISMDAPQTFATPQIGDTENTADVAVSIGSSNPVTTSNTPQTLLNAGEAETQDITVSESGDKPVGGFDSAGQASVPTLQSGVGVENPHTDSAFATYALTFRDPGDKPLLAVILLAETVEQADAVSKMGIPVTLAVSPVNPDATAIIAQYRLSGGEVVMMLPNEGGLSLQDIELGNIPDVISIALDNTTGVIGVIDGTLDGNAAQVNATLAELNEIGYALVSTTSVALDSLEAKGAATSVIGLLNTLPGKIAVIRELDNAVVHIGETSSGTVLGSASTDTVAAIEFWLKSQKAQQVILAPVSAAILRN